MASRLGLVFFVAISVLGGCHGLYHKTRQTWHADPPREALVPFQGPAVEVVLYPTDTPYCDVSTCSNVVLGIQRKHMNEEGMRDIGYNFVVGGCTGIFPGSGWEGDAPYAERSSKPSVHIGVVGRYSDQSLQSNMASVVNQLIQEGINKGKINSNYKLKCKYQNGVCPSGFKAPLQREMGVNEIGEYYIQAQ